jgi:hypothetical protein
MKNPIIIVLGNWMDKSLNQFYKTFNDVKFGDDDLIYKRLCSVHPYYYGDIYPKF